jgi:hypothetical protein
VLISVCLLEGTRIARAVCVDANLKAGVEVDAIAFANTRFCLKLVKESVQKVRK